MEFPMSYSLIFNGTLIDGNGRSPQKEAAVLIKDNQIQQVGRKADINLPDADIRRIDAGGGYILPGLIDTHVHLMFNGIDFMKAMDDYKRANGRMFPTCSEILEVLQKLGYEKPGTGDEAARGDTSLEGDDCSATDQDGDALDDVEIEENVKMELEQPPADEEI
jgi:predicted amidohydrolase YtcJ